MSCTTVHEKLQLITFFSIINYYNQWLATDIVSIQLYNPNTSGLGVQKTYQFPLLQKKEESNNFLFKRGGGIYKAP